MHPKKSIIYVAVVGAFLLTGACSEEPGPGDSTSAGLQAAIGGEEAAASAAAGAHKLPEWLLAQLRTVPRPAENRDRQMIDDECCEEVGQADECWITDAADDGIICPDYPTAPAGSPACLSSLGCDPTNTLCECESDDDCNDGGDRQGRCIIMAGDDSGLCGPAFCNGYKICSCWGGCIDADATTTPAENCAEAGLSCCEGDYPIYPPLNGDEVGDGYCSDDSTCGSGCDSADDCDDDNACTDDSCVIATGECAHADVVCDDLNECTDDACNVATGCYVVNNTDLCDDGDECTTGDVCTGGDCEPTGVLSCVDGNLCTDDSCDPATGCVWTNNTVPCTDGSACTTPDACAGGVCVGGPPVVCADVNWCTTDTCNPATGCVFTNNTLPCSDGNTCTTGDICNLGTCTPTGMLSCNDGRACTDDTCNVATGCVYTNDNSNACTDGSLCTTDACNAGNCISTPITCADTNSCTDDTCNPATGCVFTNDNTNTCTDGSLCTTDACVAGTCVGTGIVCNDTRACTDDTCIPLLGCQYTNDNTNTCTDGSACTTDACNAGNCISSAITCNDSNSCTDDTCNVATGCVFTNDNTNACSDGSACTADACVGGVCVSTPIACNDGRACTDDTCNPATGCVYTNDNTNTCTDGSLCTTDVCTAGNCVSSAVTCADANACTDDTCNPATGCVFTNDNTNACTDGSLCTTDACVAGSCVGTGITCNDSKVCTDDTCNPATGCVYTNDNTNTCTDGSACTTDACNAGNCVSTAITCADTWACTDDACNPATGCTYTYDSTNACSDGSACTNGDHCTSATTCVGTAITCNDSNLCTTDTCNVATGCVFTNNALACNDGNACTTGDVCSGGSCVGGAALTCNDGLPCTTDTCNPATGCVYTPIVNCCTDTVGPASDCTPAMGGCAATLTTIAAGGCAESRCSAATHTCSCYMSPVNTPCTAFDLGDYPPNCYGGFCGNWSTMAPNGVCAGKYTGVAPANNLCSDLWSADTTLDTANEGYLGSIANTVGATSLTKTGSTRCGYDNYRASGENCKDKGGVNGLGSQGKDVVYVFEYQTSSATQFNLYSYVVTVQADYDVAIYIEDDISSRSTCPEGNNPGADTTTDQVVNGPRCAYPYNDGAPTPPPYVVEDECNESGNTTKGQNCCDPCLSGGMAASTCGYKWCTRGYDNAGTACNQCVPGSCDALWTYPTDPINCDPGLPAPPGYSDYTRTASAVIFPQGATDGTWRKVFIVVDGEGADGLEGNFYLTVDKRQWYASPCDRVNDDPRVYDVTSVGAAGQTFLGTLANAVNSTHTGDWWDDYSCAGYSCDNTDWMGGSSCHGSASSNMFWPAEVQFKVDRKWGTGNSTYCFMTDEAVTNPADIVISYQERSDPDAPSICDESYSSGAGWCAHNNVGANARTQFTINEGEFFLFGVSEYNYRNKPCVPGVDNCNFKLSVYEGPCPAACVAYTSWYGGGLTGTRNMTGGTGSTTMVANTSASANWNGYGSGPDQLWQVNVTAADAVTFSLCGGAAFDTMLRLYDCAGNPVVGNDDGCGVQSLLSGVAMSPTSSPYFLLVDGYYAGSSGAYTVTMSW